MGVFKCAGPHSDSRLTFVEFLCSAVEGYFAAVITSVMCHNWRNMLPQTPGDVLNLVNSLSMSECVEIMNNA